MEKNEQHLLWKGIIYKVLIFLLQYILHSIYERNDPTDSTWTLVLTQIEMMQKHYTSNNSITMKVTLNATK